MTLARGLCLLAHNCHQLEDAHRTMLEGIETCLQFDLIRGQGLATFIKDVYIFGVRGSV